MEVRNWVLVKRALFALLLLAGGNTSFAATNYSQNFASSATGWTPVVDTWSVQSGQYENASTSYLRSISVYTGDTWTTDYTYKLSMNADIGSNGANRVGAVFGYQSPGNYYEVVVNMLGAVELSQWTSGTRLDLALGQVPAGTVPGIDQWFDVEIVRLDGDVTVIVGGVVAIQDFPLPTAASGQIGVLSHHNRGRFDNISVKLAAIPLFKTGFNSGVNLTQPNCTTGTNTSWQVDLTGTETPGGTQWPPTFWGVPDVKVFNTMAPCPQPPMDTNVVIELKNATDHPAGTTRVLSHRVKQIIGSNPARAGISYTVGSDGTVPDKFYVRRYLKYSQEYLDNLGQHNYFVQHEFKAATCDLPRRLELKWYSTGDTPAKPYYWLRMDRSNNCPLPEGQNAFDPVDNIDFKCMPSRGDPCPPPPVGRWFYDEFLVQISRTGTSQDRIAYAIDQQVIFDINMPVRTPKPRGIKLTPGYIQVPNVEVQVDDVEVYAEPPCGTFPCGPPDHH